MIRKMSIVNSSAISDPTGHVSMIYWFSSALGRSRCDERLGISHNGVEVWVAKDQRVVPR